MEFFFLHNDNEFKDLGNTAQAKEKVSVSQVQSVSSQFMFLGY
jgi:hypothetical protein